MVERFREQPSRSSSPPGDGHVAEARAGLDAQRAQRRDDAAAHRVGEREVGHLGREDVAEPCFCSSWSVAVMPMYVGRLKRRIVAAVRSPSAVWASSR